MNTVEDNNWIASWISLWCELINCLGTDPDAEYSECFHDDSTKTTRHSLATVPPVTHLEGYRTSGHRR